MFDEPAITKAAVALLRKMERIENSSEYFAVFANAANSQAPYLGENWSKEVDALRHLVGLPAIIRSSGGDQYPANQ